MINDLIKELTRKRKEQHISQTELAKKCNVSRTTIARFERYEQNHISISFDVVFKIIDALGLEVLLKEKE